MREMPEDYLLLLREGDCARDDKISEVERLMNEFDAHEAQEEKTLEQYKRILGEANNQTTRFLLQLILSDEEKHRAVIQAMISTLRGNLQWKKSNDSLEDVVDLIETDGRLRALTEEFIRLEKAGIREYRKLIGESTGYYYGLFELLLKSMIRDSEKHIELLEFLRQRLDEP